MIDNIITAISEHPVFSIAIAAIFISMLASLAVMFIAISETKQLSGHGLPHCPQED